MKHNLPHTSLRGNRVSICVFFGTLLEVTGMRRRADALLFTPLAETNPRNLGRPSDPDPLCPFSALGFGPGQQGSRHTVHSNL